MEITIIIPDNQVARFSDALARAGGWDGTGNKALAARRAIESFIRQTVANVEVADLDQAARKSQTVTAAIEVSSR